MSTDSTDPADSRWIRWLRRLAIPVSVAVGVGALGGGAFYYFAEVRRPAVRHSNPTAARRVATTHILVSIDGGVDASTAVALIGKTGNGPKILTIPASTVLEVPGVGPRTIALALRQSGPQSAAVTVANGLRLTVPSTLSGTAAVAARTIDALGGVTVTVPKDLRVAARGSIFSAGSSHMNGDAFIRYMTGSFLDESAADRDDRQEAGWRAVLSALTQPGAAAADLSAWTTDVPAETALALLRACAQSPAALTLPTTLIGLAGNDLVRLDEGRLPQLRRALGDFTNGAETLDGRRIRLVVGASGAIGSAVGRILVNAGYVIEMSGKSVRPADLTTIAVSPSAGDAKATGQDVAGLLGLGSVRVSTDISADADIILTVGMDWAEANGFPQR